MTKDKRPTEDVLIIDDPQDVKNMNRQARRKQKADMRKLYKVLKTKKLTKKVYGADGKVIV